MIKSKTLLERLHEELKFDMLPDQYTVLSSKFEIKIHHAFNYYSTIPIHGGDVSLLQLLNLTKCIIVDTSNSKDLKSFDLCSYVQTLHHQITHQVSQPLKICVQNKKLFRSDQLITIQQIDSSMFAKCTKMLCDHMEIKHDKLIVTNNKYLTEEQYQLMMQDAMK
eukprot:126235_1